MELIDLNNAANADLRKYLSDNFGIDKAANTSRDKLVAEIIEQEQANGITRDANTAPSQEAITGTPTAEQRELNKAKKVKIKISRDPHSRGCDDVYTSINGVAYIIQRDKTVEVPEPVYQVLIQATETRYGQAEDGSLVPRTVQSYPVSLVG
ncbi:hypothetical protein EHZ47_01805 [Aeromonas jandaei]|uniref:hypothetical protein n=1 Tax=Aeromonas jandaei TaxID=650 RepID=UPI000F53C746|nr:hypothetical protein [Aeromonas jandaei]RQM78852.1 hypothetical protein EHZ47_01805 [Aeromonas jandaei]